MNHKQGLLAFALVSLLLVGCASSNSNNTDETIKQMSARLPLKVDAATTVVGVRSDGRGGLITEEVVDTSMARMPSQEEMANTLCDVRPDSPPSDAQNPFTSLTYVYRDTQGKELATLHFERGECPGQRL